MGFFSKIKNEEWIEIDITIMALQQNLPNIRQLLQPYAEKLGWELISENRTTVRNDVIRKNVSLIPSKKNVNVSPKYLYENKDKIIRLSFEIFRDLLYKGLEEKAQENYKTAINITQGMTNPSFSNKKDIKMYFLITESYGFLTIQYPLEKRLQLEKESNEVAIKIFNESFKDVLKGMMNESGDINKIASYVAESFNIKID